MIKSSKASLSGSEYALMEKTREMALASFSADEASKLMNWSKSKAYKTTSGLKKKLILKSAGTRYMPSAFFSENDPYAVASSLVWPSYISFWTALAYHKLTEQLPRTIYVATTRQKKDLTLDEGGVKFVKISPGRLFGYEKIGEAAIAEKEKALIDSLLLPRYAGGIKEVEKALKNAWSDLDARKLADYGLRMKNKTLLKRLGYLIEKNGLKNAEKELGRLKKNIGRGYSKLDPQNAKTNKYDESWGLIINA